jgi:hypothetical protein|tara:strand:+ start:255 stop:380 length:126 start_codon:yes stop_codon:yes gene_type:complete
MQPQKNVLNLPKVNFNFLDDSMAIEDQELVEAIAEKQKGNR